MHFAKTILLTVLAIALATYVFDCLAMTTPEQAKQCCDTMHCSSHGHEHSQDCCQTTQSIHAPFVPPTSVSGLSFSSVFVAVLPGFNASQVLDSSTNVVAAHCHAPPIPQASTPSPLRI
jgi:hypothetical protein